jgi:uncharacterized membrane protein YdbT with pleckstrin-like domain
VIYHEHPLRILRYSAKNIWLLIFPLIRGLNVLRINKDVLYEWLRGAWFDILIIGLIVLFGYVRWHYSEIEVSDSSITHREGFIFRVRTTIPYSNISSSSFERPFYLAPFRASRLRCDTSAGLFSASDMKLMVSDDVCGVIAGRLPGIKKNREAYEFPKPSVWSVILFSVFFSSGLSGTIYVATFFFKGGSIARDVIGTSIDRITDSTEWIAGSLLRRIPDAAVVIGALFVGAWLISAIVNLLKYSDFSLHFTENDIKVAYGIITRKEYRLTAKHINYTDLRQNLIMKLLKVVAVHISCAGYGNKRSRLPVLLPVMRESTLSEELDHIGVSRGRKNEFTPKFTGYWQHIWIPAILAAAVFPLHFIAADLVPELSSLTLFAAVMVEVPAVWFIIVKTAGFLTSGIAIYDDKIKISYNKWTTFHTVIAERKKLVKIELEQTIFQKIGKRCSISLWFDGEMHCRHKVRGIDVRKVRQITELLDTASGQGLVRT